MIKPQHFLSFFPSLAVKIIYCIIIIAVCSILIKISGKAISGIFNSKVTESRHIDSKKAATLGAVISSVVKYTIMFVGVCSALVNFGVPPATLAAVLGTGTVAIGLGAQNVIKDIISGFFILLENQFGVGDMVIINNVTGTVEDISIRTTQIRDANGALHIIPNGNISTVTNMCKEFINAIVDVDVDYNEDLERVLKVLNDEMDGAMQKISGLRKRPSVLGVSNLGESGVTIRILAECHIKENYSVERGIRLIVKNRLDRENISIPFPQCTIHMAERQEG